MRPGVAGFLPGDIAAIDEDTAKRVQEADFTGAHITFQTYLTLFHRTIGFGFVTGANRSSAEEYTQCTARWPISQSPNFNLLTCV